MLHIHFFDIPSRLAPFIERAVMIDLTHSVGVTWQFLPTGCFGVSLLTGPGDQDYELESPGGDGAFTGVPSQVMGTRCDRPCLAFGLSLTPQGVLHLPLHTHDFEGCFALDSEAIFGKAAWSALRAQVRNAPTPADKMCTFLAWMEVQLDRAITHGRAASLAGIAQRLRAPQPPTMVESARIVGLQRRQFERDFRRHFGTSPKRYAQVARVQQVAQLAWQGMGLAGIAAELGFTDQPHMSHAVKAVTGLSPSALLRRAQASELVRTTRPYSGGRITHF